MQPFLHQFCPTRFWWDPCNFSRAIRSRFNSRFLFGTVLAILQQIYNFTSFHSFADLIDFFFEITTLQKIFSLTFFFSGCCFIDCLTIFRGGSRTAATSTMEHFAIIVNGFQPLTIISKRSILDVASVLDPPPIFLMRYSSVAIPHVSKIDLNIARPLKLVPCYCITTGKRW